MPTLIETRLGDRLDLLAAQYLLSPMKWEAILTANPNLSLTKGFYLTPGVILSIPDLEPEKIPDLLPWSVIDDVESPVFPVEEVPPDVQPGGGTNEILTGSGWLPPAGVRALLSVLGAPDIGILIAPLDGTGKVPLDNLPQYPTLASLNAVDTPTHNAGLALKADISAVAASLALKADTSAVSAALGLKVDTSTYNTGLALKADITTVNAALALKADTSAVNTALGLKLDTATYNTGIALKLDASARNVANGVAGLDENSLILISQIPANIQFNLLTRVSNGFDFNTTTTLSASIRFADGVAGNTNAPAAGFGGTLLQFDGLVNSGAVANNNKIQTLRTPGGRAWDRSQSGGTWGVWVERAYLNRSQSFTALQDFTASATFKGGSTPAVTTALTQAGVDSSSTPRYWLVNAAATAGNRLKSISVANNGNIIFTHHADDGTAGLQVQLTTSGNLLTDGTVRPGSGSTAFTGSQFVPGATYYRTDVLGDSGGGCLTYSDGTSNGWRRVGDGTLITEEPRLKKTLKGTTGATQGSSVTIAHGLGTSNNKILSITGVIFYAPGQVVPINSRQATYATTFATDTTVFSLTNEAANSSAILSKPFAVVIEYSV